MTTTTPAASTSTAPGRRAQPTTHVRKVVGAVALVLAPWGFLAGNSAYAWATRDGGDDYTGAHAVALAGAYPDLMRFAIVSVMLGCLLVVPAVLTAMRLLRPHSPKLSLFAGSAMIVGYCCYLGAVTQGFVTLAMAEHGGSVSTFADVLDASQSMAAGTWAFILFVFGNLVGTLLFAIAMIRSRAAVPLWAGLAVLAWPILHVTGLSLGSEWFEVTGAVLQAAGFAAMAVMVLRTPDEEWDPAPTAG
jgi:hypothetical protein